MDRYSVKENEHRDKLEFFLLDHMRKDDKIVETLIIKVQRMCFTVDEYNKMIVLKKKCKALNREFRDYETTLFEMFETCDVLW